MSRKSRERREKNKAVRPDDYFSNGTFEMARFRKNTIVRNNRTPEQHAAQMEYLRTEYASKYEDIRSRWGQRLGQKKAVSPKRNL